MYMETCIFSSKIIKRYAEEREILNDNNDLQTFRRLRLKHLPHCHPLRIVSQSGMPIDPQLRRECAALRLIYIELGHRMHACVYVKEQKKERRYEKTEVWQRKS